MILYHGTTLDAWENIQKRDIDVSININRELDFGYGFYLGEKEYAQNVAFDKASIGNKGESSSVPVLIKFDIDIESIIKEIQNIDAKRILIFKKKSFSFIKCVFENRYHCGESIMSVDFIIAPLADGKVNDVMSYYKDKETTFRKLVCYYNYLKPQYFKMKQYVFKKQGLCSLKNIVSVTDLSEGRVLYEQGIKGL